VKVNVRVRVNVPASVNVPARGNIRVRGKVRPCLRTLALLAAVVLSPWAAEAGAQTPDGRDLPVIEHTLDNGMHFLLLPRPGPPTVSFVVYVPVGSVNEALGSTGVSHFLEHLLFKGSTTVGTRDVEAELALFAQMDAAHDSLVLARARRPERDPAEVARLQERIRALEEEARAVTVPNEFDQILSRNGARGLNATTGYEATQYFVDLPANRAQLWFMLEADRMRHPVFREFYAEREVIAEERRARTDTSPGGLLYEEHMAAAFRAHPYGVPPIGHMDDIQNLTRAQVEEHYRLHYGPDNTIVAIVGDFDADSAAVWAERYFGPLSARGTPPPVVIREPEQRGERRIEVLFDAEPQLRMAWRVPGGLDDDAPALTMLANVLVAGRDSRLYRRMVRDDRIATSVTAGSGPGSLFPGLFTIHAVPRSPHTTAEIEAVIEEELERLRTEPPTQEELERVRTRLEASQVRRLTSSQGLAFQLASSFAVWGDWRETFASQERLVAVQPEDILRVLERYFRADQRTVAVLRRSDTESDR